MDALADYYIQQAGGGSGHEENFFGTVYVGSPYVQRDTESAASSPSCLLAVKPVAIRGAQALGRKALNT